MLHGHLYTDMVYRHGSAFISKYSGWGNIKKLGPAQYFKALYGSTLSEIWGYFFAIVLMLTVIVSLFPLIVIKNRKIYARYVLGNTLLDDNTHTA